MCAQRAVDMHDLLVNAQLTIDANALSWCAARASGAGGQHVNRTNSKVQLTCDPVAAAIPAGVLRRLRAQRPGLFDSDGLIHIESQQTRSQRKNLDDCCRRLAALIREHWRAPRPRKPTKPTRSSVRRRVDNKRKQGQRKQSRRKYGADD